jgi:predicted transcriptional regulator
MSQEAPTPRSEAAPDQMILLQQAYLLEQLAVEGANKTPGELNKKITAAAKRELELTADVANKVRRELAERGDLEMSKKGRRVSYALSATGRVYLAGLERPAVRGRTNQASAINEAVISPEVREAQKAYLLLQLLDADGQPLSRGEANRIPDELRNSLGLKPAVANYRRAKLAEQGYVRITSSGRTEHYSLTRDGLDYLAAGAGHLDHAKFTLKGKTLRTLVAAARDSSFKGDRPPGSVSRERPAPSPSELAEAVLAEFQELRRERHGRDGLVPIHEVRQRMAQHFGSVAARHDVLDDVVLGLWRKKRLSLVAISDLGDATEQQLNESIQGVHGTLFYLEAPREQPVASESL